MSETEDIAALAVKVAKYQGLVAAVQEWMDGVAAVPGFGVIRPAADTLRIGVQRIEAS